MTLLGPRSDGRPPVVSLFGAHCDDIEIGAGATLLQLAAAHPGLVVDATVVTSTPERAAETRAALADFLPGADLRLHVHELADGRLPRVWDEVKEVVEAARRRAADAGDSDLVIGPALADAHQDHRLLAELLPTAFRHHTTWQYEILKWDGDLARPNTYVPVPDDVAERTWELLYEHFVSQRHRDWFDREALLGLMRVRGVECHRRYAQAFRADKTVHDLAPDTVADTTGHTTAPTTGDTT